jgi:hypothetical protein
MKKIIAILVLLSSVILVPAHAEQTIGIGGVVGSPTGFSLNLFTAADQSIHTVAGWDLDDDEEEFTLSSHYTWRRNDFGDKGAGWFYGLGGRIQFLDETDVLGNPDGDEFEIGPSATLGLLYNFNPIEVFVKGNGTVNIVEDTNLEGDLMLGAHYNF